jgi:bifunctional non-homologous end joining protein LigD
MITENEEKISLYYNEGRSDKVYRVQMEQTEGGFIVNFQFGRRGSTLQSGTKTPAPVPYEKAKNIYDRLVAEKKGKGYTQDEDGTPYQNSEQAGQQSGLLPQLLNPIDEARIAELIAVSHWCMQEKKDGCRLLVCKAADAIEGINRKGMFVGMSRTIEQAVRGIGGDLVLDGEAIGDIYWVFDLLELDREDLRGSSVAQRFGKLSLLLEGSSNDGALRLIPSAWNPSAKRKLFDRLKAERAEGVVFKDMSAKYVPGRPTSGGDHLKFKFTATATCKVLAPNESKRSVALGVYQHPGDGFVEIGNVTIPANFRIPATGSLVEVRYLYAYVGGSLFQPVYLGERNDVDGADSVKSLKFKQGEDDES